MNQNRDRHFAEAFSQINADNRARDRKIDEQFTNQEERIDDKIKEKIDAKIEEKFLAMEMKIDAVEKSGSEANGTIWHEKGAKGKSRTVPIENKAVATGFKEGSEEKDVKAAIEQTIRVTEMKEVEYTIDCPAIPITHAFVEFQNMKIRDRYVRSASMQKTQLRARMIKISPALDVEERFHRKRLGYFKCVLHQKHGIPLHQIRLIHEKKSVVVNGQVITMTEENGELKNNKYNNIEDEVQKLMSKWLTKKSSQRL